MAVSGLDHLNMSVANFEETVEWYSRVFGFTLMEKGIDDNGPWGVISSGDANLCIYQVEGLECKDRFETKDEGRHYLAHFGLKITDRDEWEATVERENLEIMYGGDWKFPHSTAWYLKDPTGWEIEVVLWDEGEPDFSSVAHTLE